jgi:hypothetical protein
MKVLSAIFLFYCLHSSFAQTNALLKKEWVNKNHFYLCFKDSTAELRMEEGNNQVFNWPYRIDSDTIKLIYNRAASKVDYYNYKIIKLTQDSLYLIALNQDALNTINNMAMIKLVDMKKNYDPSIRFQRISFHSGYLNDSSFVQQIEIDSARNVYFRNDIRSLPYWLRYTGKLDSALYNQLIEQVRRSNARTMTYLDDFWLNDSLRQLFIISIDCNNHTTYIRTRDIPPCLKDLSNFLNTLHNKIEWKKTDIKHTFITEEFIPIPD